jgi:hypothetical protein
LPFGVIATPRQGADVDCAFLGPGLHVDRRHRAACGVDDEGGLAIRRDRHVARVRADGDVVGLFGLVFTSIVDTESL